MTVLSQALRFIRRTVVSDSAVSKMTGIPRSTVGYVMRGQRDLPGKYFDVTMAHYGERAISEMENAGLPDWDIVNQLDKTPNVLGDIIDDYNIRTYDMAIQRALNYSREQDLDLSAIEIEAMVPDIRKSYREYLQKSKMTTKEAMEWVS